MALQIELHDKQSDWSYIPKTTPKSENEAKNMILDEKDSVIHAYITHEEKSHIIIVDKDVLEQYEIESEIKMKENTERTFPLDGIGRERALTRFCQLVWIDYSPNPTIYQISLDGKVIGQQFVFEESQYQDLICGLEENLESLKSSIPIKHEGIMI